MDIYKFENHVSEENKKDISINMVKIKDNVPQYMSNDIISEINKTVQKLLSEKGYQLQVFVEVGKLSDIEIIAWKNQVPDTIYNDIFISNLESKDKL